MTNIVKAHAVVDDRTYTTNFIREPMPLTATPVLKQHAVAGSRPQKAAPLYTVDAGQDELNRILVQIAAAKDELGTLTRELNDVRQELGSAQSLLQVEVADADTRTQFLHDLQEEARQKSEQLLTAAQQECDAIREAARMEGFKEGYTAGMEQAVGQFQEENEPKAALLAGLIDKVTAYNRMQIEENEANLVNMIIAVVQKVVHKELSEDPATLVNLLYDIVDENRREATIKIFLAKDLLPVEAKASQEVREMISAMGANISVISDDSIEPGSIIVETPKGITDVSIGTQLDNIATALKEG